MRNSPAPAKWVGYLVFCDFFFSRYRIPAYITVTQSRRPKSAGTITDVPASLALNTLQIIFAMAIRTRTVSPITKLRFHHARPRAINEIGTVSVSNHLDTSHGPLSQVCSNCKKTLTCSLVTLGLANQNMLVNRANTVAEMPVQLRLYAKKQYGIRKSGRIYQLA